MRRRYGLLAAWCVLLALGTWWTSTHFRLSADLRHFMPAPRTDAQRLLLLNVGENPASRLLLVALDGDSPAVLARLSSELAQALDGSDQITFVTNGVEDAAAFPEELLAYRYLLTDSFDGAALDRGHLERALAERAADLASPAAAALEELLPRDPTLEVLRLADRWRPREEPRRVDGAWFTADGRRALLLVETRAPAFDPDAQAEALQLIRTQFVRLRGDSDASINVTGSGYFSAIIKAQMQREAAVFGAVATAGLLVLLWIAYRRAILLLLGALPLLSGSLAGLIAVGAWFDSVHGITLAFGFTLIGVAQDYPMHLFSHLRHDHTPLETARGLWKPLLTGVASTCIAYLAFLASGVIGLAQLACLTVIGLAVAAACTRFLLPRIVSAPALPVRSSPALLRTDARLLALPRLEWVVVPLLLVCAFVLHFTRGDFWQDDLSRLAPVPPALLEMDTQLRRDLPTPDLRHLAVVGGASADEVLTQLEELDAELGRLQASDVIEGYEHAARFLPSEAAQARRAQALPDAAALGDMVRHASEAAGFTEDVFQPFVDDVARARELPPLTWARLADTPLGARVGTLLFERDGAWFGLVSFHQIADTGALARTLEARPGVVFLDLKDASQDLLAEQRAHMLRCLAIAAVGLVAVVFVALRSTRRAFRVLAPMMLTTLVIITVLRASGIELTLFHLVSLVLAAGLGLDYALFFEHASARDHDQERTLHALLVCAVSTLLVFALLALSRAPVLAAIGTTVTIGVISNFLLSVALSRGRRAA